MRLLILLDRLLRVVREWRCQEGGHRWYYAPARTVRICVRCNVRETKA